MILNIYKPSTWTSFDVVKKIKIITKEKKVGHGGTLDPFAEGVLVIGTNIDTKKLSNISRCNKTYIATIKLGIHTDSFDRDGKIIKINEEEIKVKTVEIQWIENEDDHKKIGMETSPPVGNAHNNNQTANGSISTMPAIPKYLGQEVVPMDSIEHYVLSFKIL